MGPACLFGVGIAQVVLLARLPEPSASGRCEGCWNCGINHTGGRGIRKTASLAAVPNPWGLK